MNAVRIIISSKPVSRELVLGRFPNHFSARVSGKIREVAGAVWTFILKFGQNARLREVRTYFSGEDSLASNKADAFLL